MRLRFTQRATQDLADIADHIREHDPVAALRVREAILESLQALVVFPEMGRRQSIESVRKLVTRRYSYLVYYTIDPRCRRLPSLRSNTRLASVNTMTHERSMHRYSVLRLRSAL
jgi:toxin ParE1/3/4